MLKRTILRAFPLLKIMASLDLAGSNDACKWAAFKDVIKIPSYI